jgi:hypothetical protein
MTKKVDNWVIVIIVVLAALLIANIFLTSSVFSSISSVQLGPSGFSQRLNAQECTADGTCEVNDLQVLGDLIMENDDAIDCAAISHSSGDGDTTCQNSGFDYCLFAENHEEVRYHDSTDGTCTGEVQTKIKTPRIGKCPGMGSGGGWGGCGLNQEGVEPYYGDVRVGSTPGTNLLCCR